MRPNVQRARTAPCLLLLAAITACGTNTEAPAETPKPLVTAVGEPIGEASSKTIGAAGGSIATPDGAITVTVPAGAVAGDTPFTLQKTANPLDPRIGFGFKLLPNTLEFAKPLRVRVQVESESALSGLRVAVQDNDGQWYAPAQAAAQARPPGRLAPAQKSDLDAPLPSLTPVRPKSVVNLGLWVKAAVVPETARVPKGKTLRLRVPGVYDACESTGKVDPDNPGLSNLCLYQVPKLSATAGTLKRIELDYYEYTAPDSIPAKNPVLLSFTFTRIGLDGKAQLVLPATVTITDGGEISGTVKQSIQYKKRGGTEPYTINVSGTLTMKYVDGIAGQGYGKGEGTITVDAYTTKTRTEKSPTWFDETTCETAAITYKVKTVNDDFAQAIDLTDDGKAYKTTFYLAPLTDKEPKPSTTCTRKYSHNGQTGTEVTNPSTVIYPDFSSLGKTFPMSAPGSFIGTVERDTDAFTSTGSWNLQQ